MNNFYCSKKGHIAAIDQEEAAKLSGCKGCRKYLDAACDGPMEQERPVAEKKPRPGRPVKPQESAPVNPVSEAIENIEKTPESIEVDPVLAMLEEIAQNPVQGAEQKNRAIFEKYGAAITKAADAGNSPYTISKKLAAVGVKISPEAVKGFLAPPKGERAA